MNPCEWIVSDDTGISSKAIWSIMMGITQARDRDIPRDPSDFGRCYRLLQQFPEWRPRLGEVAAAHPKWTPMVDEWDKLTELYEEEMHQYTAPKLYKFMKELYPLCMDADGWEQTGPGSWQKAGGVNDL